MIFLMRVLFFYGVYWLVCIWSYEVILSDLTAFAVATTCASLFSYMVGSFAASATFDMYFFSLSFS